MKKIQMLMNKPVYLGLSTLDLSKTVVYGFWYDYVKPKYCENGYGQLLCPCKNK